MGGGRDELREILALTREFAAAELRPKAEQWERAGALGDDVLAQLAELGFLGMLAPESAGGMGLDRPSWLAALEQLAWGEASVALAVGLHTQVTALLERSGSEAARQRWLPLLAAGVLIGCGETAPAEGTGSHAQAEDGGWRLSGALDWVGNARPQGLLPVRAASPAGALLLLVPLAAEGVVLGPPAGTLGMRPLGLRRVTLQDVRVSGDALLGEPGAAAAATAVQQADAARLVAAVAVGIAQAALDHARDYADVREQFGRRLREFEGIRHKLADMAIRVAAARALLQHSAAEPEESAAAMAKVCAGECAMYVTTEAVQVFGGYGYMRDYPVEKLMRDARAMSLLGGTDERHRSSIAAQLYR